MARYSKQDYELVAAVLHAERCTVEAFAEALPDPEGQLGLLDNIAAEFSRRFSRDNGAFDRQRFVIACNTGKGIRESLR